MAKPIPHTHEWFEALRRFNPQQARHTEKILELAGRLDVCSVCGDDPATDYEVQLEPFPRGAVTTFRLCDDCLAIREAGGEQFRPL